MWKCELNLLEAFAIFFLPPTYNSLELIMSQIAFLQMYLLKYVLSFYFNC